MNFPSTKNIKSFPYLWQTTLLMLVTIMITCSNPKKGDNKISDRSKVLNPELSQKPNILWIVAEDMSSYLPSFGDSTIVSPHLSKLAAEGVCYDNFYAPHPVCAPARAAIITGMYANSIGASHMRTGPWFGGRPSKKMLVDYQKAMPPDIAPYEAIPSAKVKMFTEYLRQAGYYCSNNSKEDYQFIKTPTAWDDSSNKAHWRNRSPGQPFFAVFNIGVTHEAQIWKKQMDSLWVDKDLNVPVPPYLPDTDIAKKDIRRMYSNIKEMDAKVGEILQELKNDGLLDNTIIFWYTDHGGPLPRQKRMLYDSGLKVPMIIRFPAAQFAGERDKRLISFIDLAPTLLSLASIPPPSYIQGKAFLGKYIRVNEPKYVFGAADRFDETTDKIRSVRDERFKYIKYYQPEKPMFLEVSYRNQMPIMQELLRLREEDSLTDDQSLWFRDHKPKEELFDVWNDPYELNDLSKNPEYLEKLLAMRAACQDWTAEINDTGLLDEHVLLSQMLPDFKQPITDQVQINNSGGMISFVCSTEGASIGYKILESNEDPDKLTWLAYELPFDLNKNQTLMVISHRLGYQPSEVQKLTYHEIH